ncbi:MAG TPA: sugar phosphate nucleotidyltransferase [Halanaerobiales bacterium]|nr:sugar phosphate nucleotidyltransferase [Halanaerobiales bacterium]
MKAVIMAGGEGSRLRPLTCDLPKPMVPVVNYPVMEYIIELLKRYGITDIMVTSFYLPQIIESYFEDGAKWGVKLNYFVEEEPLGTAGSVHNASEFLDETFIVISGDAITDFDLRKAFDFHQKKGAEATLLLEKKEVPLDYGVVMTDNEHKIIRFLEKPDWGQVFSDTINTGIYILEPLIFDLFEKGKNFDFSKDLFPLMLKRKMRLYGLALQGYWNDIGSLEEYTRTQFELLEGKINLPLKGASEIGKDIWVEEGVNIAENVELEGPLYIGKDSIIAAGASLKSSIIGKNCYIFSDASLKKSVLWDNNTIGRNSEIRGAVLANHSHVKERAAIFDGAVLGKDVIIGRESRIRPGVKIWPDKEIDDRTSVESNIVWPARRSQKLFTSRGINGESNIDITPEFISNLAVAYGSTLSRDVSVVISSDSYRMSRALKRAAAAGLQAAGINIIDIGDAITTAISRFSVVELRAEGGIHIRTSYKNPMNTIVEFLNKYGVNFSVAEQKGVEKKYSTMDYKRVFTSEIGSFSTTPEIPGRYVDRLLESVDLERIKENYYQAVVDYEYDNLGSVLPLLLKKLNCRLLSTRHYSSNHLPLSLEERLKARSRVVNIMKNTEADLGVIIDHNGEELYPVTGKGKILNRSYYRVLLSYILLEKGYKKLFLPVNTPRAVELMAENYGAEVEYTSLSPREAMARYYQNGKNEGIMRFYPYSDGLAGLVLLLEKMAVENINLEQLLGRLPEFYLKNAEIPCDWRNKGKVMRFLSQEADENTEMIDGIKFHHRRGWALVIPDNERAVFHVYAEGQDMETAESLTGFYLNKVKEIMSKE